MSKQVLHLAYALLICSTLGSAFAETSQNDYKTLAEVYLPAWEQFNAPKDVASLEKLKKENKKLTLQVQELNEYEKRDILFSILAKQPQSAEHPSMIDKTSIKKMELFCGGENKLAHLFAQFCNAVTIGGELQTAYRLTHPYTNDLDIRTFARTVQMLVDDPKLLEQLEEFLNIMKQAEPGMLTYWAPENSVNEELFKNVYFPNWLGWLNNSSVALETLSQTKNALNTFALFEIPTLTFVGGAAYKAQDYKLKKQKIGFAETGEIIKAGAKTIVNSATFMFDPYLKNYKDFDISKNSEELIDLMENKRMSNPSWNGMPKNFRDLLRMIEVQAKIDGASNPSTLKFATIAYVSVIGGALVYGAKTAFDNLMLQKNILQHLQARLIATGTYANTARKMHHFLKDTVLADRSLTLLDKLGSYFSTTQETKKLDTLLSLLNHNTFSGSPSIFSLAGRILSGHTTMKELKDELVPLIAWVGEIDTYVSVAKLYKKHQSTPAHYCFAEFVQAQKPYLDLHGFWNPFIDANTVVTNDITVGGGKLPNNMIVTGPNTGGKSTVIKGMFINLLLAQSFGITSAARATLTVFTKLNCYLNITDDISAGTSLFQAEVNRAKELIEMLRSLRKNEFCFIIMDEIFSGTSPKEGELAAYQFARELAKFDNSMCCLATHFPKITELENEQTFKNYQVKVLKNEDGTLTRPYKLEEGISTLNIAFDLLQEQNIFSADTVAAAA